MSLIFKNSPLYLQIAQDLRRNIQKEIWKEGERIPTDKQMCEQYHVSRITVRKAVDELVKDNLIVRKKAIGSFVTTFEERNDDHYTSYKSFTNEMKEVGIDIETLKVNVMLGFADPKIAKFLDIRVGDKVFILKRVRGYEGKGFAYFITYVKYKDIYSLKPSDYNGSFYEYLQKLGIRIKSVREIVESCLPNKEVATMLRITQKTPILKRVRIINNKKVDYYEYSECFYIGSEYKYYIDFDQMG